MSRARVNVRVNGRRMVTIDPEDREQVERLAARFHNEEFVGHRRVIEGGYTDAMQAALRSLIADPKPDEPLGLGAVVECDGSRWVGLGKDRWLEVPTNKLLESRRRSWAEFHGAVRVLSEGVTS